VTLEIAPDGTPVEAPKQRGRQRTRLANDQTDEELIQAAYLAIAQAEPPKLREIAAFAESERALAKSRRLEADAALFEAIIERAERRLAWFERQGEKVA
jgi:hypothetical protein